MLVFFSAGFHCLFPTSVPLNNEAIASARKFVQVLLFSFSQTHLLLCYM